ncbi:MAG: hypothetical protein QM757_07295 [Paludibaculum sp.]
MELAGEGVTVNGISRVRFAGANTPLMRTRTFFFPVGQWGERPI